jgi:hypothetical protein
MATPQNIKNTRVGSPRSEAYAAGSLPENNRSKKTYTTVRYGNDHGSISFGHIHKQADVTADVLLQASDGRHSIIMDKDGPRKGGTTMFAPGVFQIQCGDDKSGDENSLVLTSINGDIIIRAENGRVRIEGLDIDLIAKGPDNTRGNIQIKAEGGNLNLKANNITIDGTSSYKLVTTGQAQITANSTMKIYSSVIQGVTDAVANRDSKVGGKDVYRSQTKVK